MSHSLHRSDDRDADFFIVYLPTPPATSRWLSRAIVTLVGGAAIGSLGVALAQRDPGSGRWDIDRPIQLDGRVTPAPTPVLTTSDHRHMLLVGDGKHAASLPAGASAATATGTLLSRDGWEMLEMTTISTSTFAARAAGSRSSSRPATQLFRGEILDAKCYLGAMKPGDGKPHKACAALCLRGGVPPMLRTSDDRGASQLYLLVAADGSTIPPEELIRFVADPIELRASIDPAAPQPTLRLVAGSVGRR
jgi:hypothetical protein